MIHGTQNEPDVEHRMSQMWNTKRAIHGTKKRVTHVTQNEQDLGHKTRGTRNTKQVGRETQNQQNLKQKIMRCGTVN